MIIYEYYCLRIYTNIYSNLFLKANLAPTIAGIIPAISNPTKDMENTFAAGIPNNPNKLMRIASLVPNPATLIGIKETKVPKGKIDK